MPTLSNLLGEHTHLSGSAVVHLQSLVSEWQLLADLAFSDLLLWVESDGGGLICAAQARATTGSTSYPDDRVAAMTSFDQFPLLQRAWKAGRVVREPAAADRAGTTGFRREAIPVRHQDTVIAVVERDSAVREITQLESAYVDAADDLFQMIVDGSFPPEAHPAEIHSSPRAGDGLLRLDADGRVVYASPNALSAYHRLGHNGEVMGHNLAALTRPLINDPFDAAELEERIRGAVEGRWGLRMEVEARGATVLFRAMPLHPHGRASGALVLVRDVTEVRSRDRALLSKDATIREIHHRVKNNLQTVAALLRLQGRRSTDPSVRRALGESVRRVASIALVHETLSTSPDDRVDLDQIVDRLASMISDVAAAETPARVNRIGTFGVLGAELATPLVMVLAEIVQNALQHAFVPPFRDDNQVTITVERSARQLAVVVTDNGIGLPDGFTIHRARGLGLQIVRTLVASELLGAIAMRSREHESGTVVTINVPLRSRG